MLVAKKNYYDHNYSTYEQDIEYNREPSIRSEKNAQNENISVFMKISIFFCIILISGSMFLILLRYTSITETKASINSLNKDVDVLNIEIQQIKAELDSVSRSDIIEEKAINQLHMQYPKYEQMVFLKSNETNNIVLSTSENIKSLEKHIDKKSVSDYLILSIEKLYSLLD